MSVRPPGSYLRFSLAAALVLSGCSGDGPGGEALNRLPGMSFARGGVEALRAYVATPAGADRAALYFTLANEGGVSDELVSITSDAAERIEIHRSVRAGARLTMERVAGVVVPPGWQVHFVPGSYHAMLTGLSEPLDAGSRITVTLEFKSGRTLDLTAEVVPYGQLEGLLFPEPEKPR